MEKKTVEKGVEKKIYMSYKNLYKNLLWHYYSNMKVFPKLGRVNSGSLANQKMTLDSFLTGWFVGVSLAFVQRKFQLK